MKSVRIFFFGSTIDSVIVLEKLFGYKKPHYALKFVALVTQPPKPKGRQQETTPTPVALWGATHNIPVLSFGVNPEKPWLYEDDKDVIRTLLPYTPDLLISASYGQKIPSKVITSARYGGLNIHPSLLPRWRGADPVPRAILAGDTRTGVTIVTLRDVFDDGKIITQLEVPISQTDLADALRTKLFLHGADLLIRILPDFLNGTLKGKIQKKGSEPYAARFMRQDGYEPWDSISGAADENARMIERKLRALSPWPGVWTTVIINNKEKRLKILKVHIDNNSLVLDEVQLEGKNPVTYAQFRSAYLTNPS